MKTNSKELILPEMLNCLYGKQTKQRYRVFKKILKLSEKNPEILYPYWDFFCELLKSDKPDILYIAIHILSNLVKVDKENRFMEIYSRFFSLIFHESIIPAMHAAGNAGKIVLYRPELRKKITRILLSTDEEKIKCKHKELVKAYVISSFDEYFEESEDKEKIVSFILKQLNSKSPKTKKTARDFLKKMD